MEEEYAMLRVTKQTKEELDKQRSLPQGQVTVDDFLNYLLEQNKKNTK